MTTATLGKQSKNTHTVAAFVASFSEAVEAWKNDNDNSSFSRGYENQFSFDIYDVKKETGFIVLRHGSPFREEANVLVKVDEQTCVIYNTVEDAVKTLPITKLVRLSIPVWGRSDEEEEEVEVCLKECLKRGLELI